jgi:hypothetical protein
MDFFLGKTTISADSAALLCRLANAGVQQPPRMNTGKGQI